MNHYYQNRCSSVKTYSVFGETHYLIVKICTVGSRFIYIVGTRLPDKTISNPRTQFSMVTAVRT